MAREVPQALTDGRKEREFMRSKKSKKHQPARVDTKANRKDVGKGQRR